MQNFLLEDIENILNSSYDEEIDLEVPTLQR